MRVLTLALLALATCAPLPTTTGTSAHAVTEEGWPMHVIKAGLLGADGTADNAALDIVSAWEQSGKATRSSYPGANLAAQPWPTQTLTATVGAEDAIYADVDADGSEDVVIGSEAKKLRIYWGPAFTTSLTITTPDRLLSLAFMDGKIVTGGKVSPCGVALWTPGPNPRAAAGWVRTQISESGWVMNMIPLDVDVDGDLDLLLSDRDYVTYSNGTRRYDLQGARWLEAPAWTNHSVGVPEGSHKMVSVADLDGDGALDVIDTRSSATVNTTTLQRSSDWLSWVGTVIPQPSGVGQVHATAPADINHDGALDLFLTYSNAGGDLSGVVWLEAPNWTRHEVSGALGEKFDNALARDLDGDGDLDVVTSEQIEIQSVVWYENQVEQM